VESDSSSIRTQVKSAGRTLDVLEALGCARSGQSFTDLVALLGLPKSSLHELLGVLVSRGYVLLDPSSRRYSLGIRAWEVGQPYIRQRELLTEARPAMDDVVAVLNETVQLAVLDGVDNVYLAKVDCAHPLRLQSEVGARLPAHATGLGKVLLAHLPLGELTARLQGHSLQRFTANTTTDVDQLRLVLARIRSLGFALDNEETTPGVRCVAVAIRDHQGVAAALSTSIPRVRATPDLMAAALRLLARASLDVSRRLGSTSENGSLARLTTLPNSQLMALVEEGAQWMSDGLTQELTPRNQVGIA